MRSRHPTRTAHVPNASLSLRELTAALMKPVAVRRAEELLASLLDVGDVVLFASARGALSACIRTLAAGGEVALPAFTCAAVPNAALSAGSTPVYVDVDSRGLVPADAWPVGPLPVVQDTYGFAAEGPGGRTFIRDSAHRAYPLRLDGASVAVTSFEHSKVLSAGRGGLAATDDLELAGTLRRLRADAATDRRRVRRHAVTVATYAMGRLDSAGRHRGAELFRKVAWHLDESRLLGQSPSELAGHGVDLPLLGAADPIAAHLMVSQVRRAAPISAHRARIVSVYDRRAGVQRGAEPLVRYPLTVEDPDRFEAALERAGWDVRGRWFNGPVHPRTSDLSALGYRAGSAPNAERLAARVVNLPTHPLISPQSAEGLIDAAIAAGAEPVV
jgi:dTDP-4-amino-4,6-dideoxygalactose transaminase